MRFIGSVFRKVQYFSQNEIDRFSASSLITRTNNDITQIKTFLNQCLRIAMLNNPPIPILDEATSSVDTRTGVLIQETMAEMMKGKTSFVIAHRLSTIKDSANILYMQYGDIPEVGNHETLMTKKRSLHKTLQQPV